MARIFAFALAVVYVLLSSTPGARGQTKAAHVTTHVTALEAYDKGFAYDVMRAPADGGVMLGDMVLIENDGPGAGRTENDSVWEEIYRGVLARKTFFLEDSAAFGAHLVIYLTVPAGTHYYVIANGKNITGPPTPWHEGVWQWVDVGTLRKGENTFVVGCDAPPGRGCRLLIAREDEYDRGGGKYTIDGSTALISAGQVRLRDTLTSETPRGNSLVREVQAPGESARFEAISVGRGSARSTDGGKTWVGGKLGPNGDIRGEYTARLNLKRFKRMGKLLSGPIDLWDGIEAVREIKPACTVKDLNISFSGATPKGTTIIWQVRRAETPDMMSSAWGEFTTVGTGERGTAHIDAHGERYLQWRAMLTTENPLATPVARGITVKRTLEYLPLPHHAYYVWKYNNVEHRYSSMIFHYEKWDEPQLKELRERLKLDTLLRGVRGDFEKINRLRHYVSGLWHHGDPIPDFPEWNALQILDRRDRVGVGGFCLQFTTVFIQSLLSLGYTARHVNVFAHENTEVYVDELAKWVFVDPESMFDSYEYDATTGMPLSALEQHRAFLTEYAFSPKRPIDWQSPTPWAWPAEGKAVRHPDVDYSTFTGWINDTSKPDYPPQHRLVGFMRMMPRNDYFSHPYPRPLNQGLIPWPWNGYLNWYDEATPRKLQYSLQTDREADFYPTLNRVQFSAVEGNAEGEIAIQMITFTPNFDTFETNIDNAGWTHSPSSFVWELRPSAVNTLEMRVTNRLGLKGKTSTMQVMWNYKAPYQKKDW